MFITFHDFKTGSPFTISTDNLRTVQCRKCSVSYSDMFESCTVTFSYADGQTFECDMSNAYYDDVVR